MEDYTFWDSVLIFFAWVRKLAPIIIIGIIVYVVLRCRKRNKGE